MPTVTITKGLPGSGKTTWANEIASASKSRTIVICKDDLRRMLHGGVYTPSREKTILAMRDAMIREAMRLGRDVIVADTNLNPAHETRIRQIVDEWNRTMSDATEVTYAVQVRDFTDVPIQTCIERDLQREHSVGERVIRDMYNRYIRIIEAPAVDLSLPGCIICDLDGTLANLNGRNPYDASTCGADLVNEHVRRTLFVTADMFIDPDRDDQVLLFSGRKEKDREPTERWLRDQGIGYDVLYMRADDDNRPDHVIKRELYDRHIRGRYNVLLVLDDRLQVCRVWYELGLPLLRVGDPDASF